MDGQNTDLWLIDSASGAKSDRFTFGPGVKSAPVWAPDGANIVFYQAGQTGNLGDLFIKPSNMGGDQKELFKSNERKVPTDWSRDGKTLVFTNVGKEPDISSLALDGSKAEIFLKTDAVEHHGRLSPDARWIASTSNATGRPEINVRPFPLSADRTGQQMVSSGGGDWPMWRRDGKELFYFEPPQRLMAVDVASGDVFKSGQPKELFVPSPDAARNGGLGWDWDVSADGSRFLGNVRGTTERDAQPAITVVLNWTATIRK
jgi:Tol biopolymer transport system component